MRHAVFPGGEEILLAQREPDVPPPGELRLQVLACAVCGSDLRLWRRGAIVTPGHEIVGRIDAPGHPRHNTRVLVYIPVFCGACASCARGDTHLCPTATLVGWQRHGGYAESLVVPERCLIPVPDDIPTELAPLLLDVIGTPAHGVRLARRVVQEGAAAVIGAGPVGLGAVLALPRLGFPEVHVAEPVAYRREIAEAFGAHDLGSLTEPRFALVVESSGKDEGRQRALELTALGGVCMFVGESDGWRVTETRGLRRKDFWILRSFYFPLREVEENWSLLRGDLVRYRRLVDEQVPLEELPELFRRFAQGSRIKPLVELRSPD